MSEFLRSKDNRCDIDIPPVMVWNVTIIVYQFFTGHINYCGIIALVSVRICQHAGSVSAITVQQKTLIER